ncbi:hypothetical protein V6N11_047077 [Hibiscus sabdariffa]|uniref:Uncharacterized protein n=2 Tax=Hibiscus sabdariffa TaxID=183260 RepID=A0ABR1ZBD7_9ROSI
MSEEIFRPLNVSKNVVHQFENWHQTAKKQIKQGRHSENTTRFSSRPPTPTHGMSPVHPLHSYPQRRVESCHVSPRHSEFENNQWDPADSFANSPNHHDIVVPTVAHGKLQLETSELVSRSPSSVRTQHTINIGPSNFSFVKR